LPDRKTHTCSVETLVDELVDLYLEYDILMKVVKQQRAEYWQLKELFLKTSEELNAKLQRLVEAEGLEPLFAE
jgi:hypothetical protein